MEKSVARVLYGQGTSLNLTSRKIKAVPECVFRIRKLSVLQLTNNSITALPAELLSLRRVSLPSFFFFLVRFAPELICLLEHFQDNSLNVLHGVQICD